MFFRILPKLISVQGLAAAQGLLFTFLAVRFLDPETFGSLRYVMVLLPFFMLATLPTYDNLILREAASGLLLNLSRIVRIRGLFGLVASIIFCLIILFSRHKFSTEVVGAIFLILLLLPFYETTTGYKNYLIGIGLREQVLKIQIRNKLFSTAILLFGILVFGRSEPTLVVFLLVFMVATTIPNIFTHAVLIVGRKSPRRQKIMPLTKEAGLTSLASGIWIASYAFDRLIVERELGPESLAYYSIIMLIPLMAAQLADALIPFYYKNIFFNKTSYKNIKVLTGIFFLFFVIIICYGIFAHTIYPHIFGEFYTYPLFLSLLSGLLIATGSMEFFFIHYLYKGKKSRQLIIYNVSSIAILFVTLTLILTSLDYYSILIVLVLKQLALPIILIGCEKVLCPIFVGLGDNR